MTGRLEHSARVDRDSRIHFTLDGREMSGLKGDTLASALLSNGVTLVGRSFKYHRPRGFLAAGPEEPNGLFTLGEGPWTEPNIAGTSIELTDGLAARCQNAWPSVGLDLMAINAHVAPLLSSGFYYKTFMGPLRNSWMWYEPSIRRAAGLGRGVHQRDPDHYMTRHAFADLLVVGGGPAGLVAALVAGRAGARVVLVEQDFLLGGGLLREDIGSPAAAWIRRVEARLASLPNVQLLRRTVATGLYDDSTFVLVEQRDPFRKTPAAGDARQIVTMLRSKSAVFATGAIERPIVFANNDKPGVMLASAVRTYLNRFAVACGTRAVVVTNNDSAYATALDLAKRGVEVVVADLRHERDLGDILDATASGSPNPGIEVITDAAVEDVLGRRSVKGIVLRASGRRRRLECDLVCMSGGWSPVVNLTAHGGIRPKLNDDIAAFVPGGYAAGHFGAGAITGEFTIHEAIEQGLRAGRAASEYCGREPAVLEVTPPALESGGSRAADRRGFAPIFEGTHLRPGHAFVDFQFDVTVKDIGVAYEEGYRSLEHLKRYTTLGMGTDQGRTSNTNGMVVMDRLQGKAASPQATTTFRPPFVPLTIGAIAGRTIGRHFRPTRLSPMHAWHRDNGAEMIEAGPWLRPWFYRWAGSSAETAYLEEMRLVRKAVGISDLSTLGKIEVIGPDAGEFLDRVYVNGFSKLPVGKARYGVMLNDDGTVLDDGTASRLSATRYFVTASTAHGDEVLSHLEFLLQAVWPELRVQVVSVTDELAGMVVAGAMSRRVLEQALRADVSDANIPHMGVLELDFDGVPLRLLRISFSGELAYEVYCPADHGIALWEHLLKHGEPLGLRPYGLEALASLRIEKGHVAGLELDQRNTLDDLGLGRMASKEKPFVGKALRDRPALQDPQRWSLVGLECLESGKRLRGGSILFGSQDRLEGHGRGYITSVTWSTELGKFIALGLYQGGVKHAGEEVVCSFPLENEQVRAKLVQPAFVDPTGERFRA